MGHAGPGALLQHGAGSIDVGFQEGGGILQGPAHMGLGGSMHHGVGSGNQLAHEVFIADISHDQLHVDPFQVFAAPGVGELVQHHHLPPRLYEGTGGGGSDETGSPGQKAVFAHECLLMNVCS